MVAAVKRFGDSDHGYGGNSCPDTGENCVSSVLVAAFILISAGCGMGEAHFQTAWKRDVIRAQEAVQDYWERQGELPSSLADIPFSTSDDLSKLVQYSRKDEGEYWLWINREDIKRVQEDPDFLPTPGGPKDGDVVGKFNVDGRVLYASWRSIWS